MVFEASMSAALRSWSFAAYLPSRQWGYEMCARFSKFLFPSKFLFSQSSCFFALFRRAKTKRARSARHVMGDGAEKNIKTLHAQAVELISKTSFATQWTKRSVEFLKNDAWFSFGVRKQAAMMLTALQRIRMMTSQENDNIIIFHWRTESWVLFWDMVNLFSFGYHVIDRAYASTDCTGGG